MTTINSGDSLINNPVPASQAPALPTPPKSEFWGKVAQFILNKPSQEAVRSESETLAKLDPQISRSNLELAITSITTSLFSKGEKDIDPLILHVIAGDEEGVIEDLKRPLGDIKDTALLWAAYLGHTQIVPLLLNADAKVDSEKGSPLILTCQSEIFRSERNSEVIRLLLEKGCPVNSTDRKGKSALAYAAEGGHFEAVKLLLEHGANPVIFDYLGFSPLMRAIEKGHIEVAKLLIEHDRFLNFIQVYNQTPLMRAASAGYLDIIKLLLAKGADVNADTSKYNGCVSALWAATKNGHAEVVKVLLEHGASSTRSDSQGLTPLMCAIDKGHLEVAKVLIEHGAPVNLIQGFDKTPLILASARGYLDGVKLLLAKGVDVNEDGSKGKSGGWRSALWAAAVAGNIELVKILLDAGADPGSVDKEGKTILYYVKNSRTPHWPLVRQVIKSHRLLTKEIADYLDFYRRTKLIANAFEINGISQGQTQQFEWSGVYAENSAITMAQSIRQLALEYPHLLDEDSARHLAQSLQFAADHSSRKADQYLQRIQRGMPTFILGGYNIHAAVYLIWNDLIISCDRGGINPRSLVVRHYDPNKLDSNSVNKLLKFCDIKEAEYIQFGNLVLPALLGFKKVTDENIVENLARLPWQTYGNCGRASLEGAIKAYLFLNNQKLNPSKTDEELKNETDICFSNWKILEQFILLEKYFAGELDPRLISESFVTLREAISNPAIDKELLQRLDALEAKFLHHQLAFLEANSDKQQEIKENLIWFLFLANSSKVIDKDLLTRATAFEAKFLSQSTLRESLLYRTQKAWHFYKPSIPSLGKVIVNIISR